LEGKPTTPRENPREEHSTGKYWTQSWTSPRPPTDSKQEGKRPKPGTIAADGNTGQELKRPRNIETGKSKPFFPYLSFSFLVYFP
jgi:hypothetical protein